MIDLLVAHKTEYCLFCEYSELVYAQSIGSSRMGILFRKETNLFLKAYMNGDYIGSMVDRRLT